MITAETKDALETQVAEAFIAEVLRDPTGRKSLPDQQPAN